MRILMEHEMYGKGELSGISMFTDYCGLVQGCRDAKLPLQPYLVTPVTGEWDTHPEILRHGFTPVAVGVENINYFDYQILRPQLVDKLRDTSFIIDAYFSNSSTQAAMLKLLLRSSSTEWHVPLDLPIIVRLSESTTDKRILPLQYSCGGGLVALGATECTIFAMTKAEVSEMSRLAERYLSSAACAKVNVNVKYLQACFDATTIDANFTAYEAERTARLATGQVNIFHAGTLHSARRVNELIILARKARLSGRNVHLILLTQDKDGYPVEESDKSWIHTYGGCNRDDVVSHLGKGDLCWVGTDYEGTGLAYMEAIYSGMMPICVKRPWLEERINSTYPLWLDSLTAAKSEMLMYAITDAQKVLKLRESQKSTRKMVTPWTHRVAGVQWHNMLRSVIDASNKLNCVSCESYFPHKFFVKAEAEGIIGEKVLLLEAVKAATSLTDKKVEFKWIGPRAARFMLMSLGYVDTGEGLGWTTVMERKTL